MAYVVLVVVLVAVAGLSALSYRTGRQLRGCCPADPGEDLRMRGVDDPRAVCGDNSRTGEGTPGAR